MQWTLGVHVSLSVLVFSRYVPSGGIAGSYGGSLVAHVVHTGVPCPTDRQKPERNNVKQGQEESQEHHDKPQAGLSLVGGGGGGWRGSCRCNCLPRMNIANVFHKFLICNYIHLFHTALLREISSLLYSILPVISYVWGRLSHKYLSPLV